MLLPPAAAHLAEAQLGVLARHQLRRHLGGGQIDARLRRGDLRRMEHGVYRVAGGARLPAQAAVAAALRAGAPSVLSGPAVLALYGVDGFLGSEPYVVLVPPGRRLRRAGFPWRTDPDPRRVTGARGEVRTAGPVDALIESAAFVDELGIRRLRLAHDVLRWRGLLRPGQLTARASELVVRGGSPALVDLLDLDGQRSTGDGERQLGRLLARFRPAPEAEVWVTPHRRLDWYFRIVRYGVEYQGTVDHATSSGRRRDGTRDRELRRGGIRITYVSAGDLEDERAVLATIAGALAARADELGVLPPAIVGGPEPSGVTPARP
jgi:hypothetical protein